MLHSVLCMLILCLFRSSSPRKVTTRVRRRRGLRDNCRVWEGAWGWMKVCVPSRTVLARALSLAFALGPRRSEGLRLGVVPPQSRLGARAATISRPADVSRAHLALENGTDVFTRRARPTSVNMAAVRGGGSDDTGEGGTSTMGRKIMWDLVGENTKWIVSITAAGVLLYRRDALAVSVIVGALSNAVLGKVLKRILRQKRPDGAPLADPGMPSSHAMSLLFLSCYLCAAAASGTRLLRCALISHLIYAPWFDSRDAYRCAAWPVAFCDTVHKVTVYSLYPGWTLCAASPPTHSCKQRLRNT